jgi:hypothetical protein
MAFRFCEEQFLPGDFHDPLTINLTRQTRVLRSLIPPASPYAAALSNASSPRELLVILSQLLAVPDLTHAVATTFRPILLPLCAQWLLYDRNEEDILIALSSLIQPHEELFSCVFFYSLISQRSINHFVVVQNSFGGVAEALLC